MPRDVRWGASAAGIRRRARPRCRSAVPAGSATRKSWEPETTTRNLRLIREARDRRGAPVPWAAEVEKELEKRAAK